MLIDDNFLSEQSILDVYSRVLDNGHDIPWTLAYSTNMKSDPEGYVKETSAVKESYQFAAGLMPNTVAYNYFWKVFHEFATKHNISYTRILRAKLNWLPRSADASPEDYHTPHVDSEEEHKVFLYYLNSSDGDTFFFNETYPLEEGSELTLNQRVSPKAGRGVVFDGNIYHASSSPIDSNHRCILNIDFI